MNEIYEALTESIRRIQDAPISGEEHLKNAGILYEAIARMQDIRTRTLHYTYDGGE